MAIFVFSGDKVGGADPDAIDVHGMSFPLGELVEVADEAIAAKLRTHSHFTEVGDGMPMPEKPRRGKPKAKVEPEPEA